MRPVVLILCMLLLASCRSLPGPMALPPEKPAGTPAEADRAPRPLSPTAMTGTGALPERLLETGILELGDRNATVSLLVITNHACRYCREFQEEHVPRLTEDFIRPGDLRLGVMILPLKKYPMSLLFASALLCAGEQSKGGALHRELFAAAPDRKGILEAAVRLGLEESALQRCLDAEETALPLDMQESFLRTLGVTLIPTFFLEGERRTGLMEYPELRGWVERKIAEARR